MKKYCLVIVLVVQVLSACSLLPASDPCSENNKAKVLEAIRHGYAIDPRGALLAMPTVDAYMFLGDETYKNINIFEFLETLQELAVDIDRYPAARLARDMVCAGVPENEAQGIAYIYEQAESLKAAQKKIEERYQALSSVRDRNNAWDGLEKQYTDSLQVSYEEGSARLLDVYFIERNTQAMTLAILAVNSSTSDEITRLANTKLEINNETLQAKKIQLMNNRKYAVEGSRIYLVSFAGMPKKPFDENTVKIKMAIAAEKTAAIAIPQAILSTPKLYLKQ
jgi:hypothetical protein